MPVTLVKEWALIWRACCCLLLVSSNTCSKVRTLSRTKLHVTGVSPPLPSAQGTCRTLVIWSQDR